MQISPSKINESAKWRGEGITEVLVVIVIMNCAIDVVMWFGALFSITTTEGSQSSLFPGIYLVAVLSTAVLSACLAGTVAYRAHWRWGGVAARAATCGGSGAAFGTACYALLRKLLGL